MCYTAVSVGGTLLLLLLEIYILSVSECAMTMSIYTGSDEFVSSLFVSLPFSLRAAGFFLPYSIPFIRITALDDPQRQYCHCGAFVRRQASCLKLSWGWAAKAPER